MSSFADEDQKKTSALLNEIERLWERSRKAFKSDKGWLRARDPMLSALVCLGRHTITGLLWTSGRQFQDWSADYRVFSESRFDLTELFGVLRQGVMDSLGDGQPLITAMDDTILRKGGRKIPAYLICTDPKIPLEDVIQAYIWRWDIEVNFRDEKQIIGIGEAQVRSQASVDNAPGFFVAVYGMLLLAAARVFGVNGRANHLRPPKWRSKKRKLRASTLDLIQHLRGELWGKALGVSNFSGFTKAVRLDVKPQKTIPDLRAAVLYATG